MSSCFNSALFKSCHYRILNSFKKKKKVDRLTNDSHPREILTSVAEKLQKNLKSFKQNEGCPRTRSIKVYAIPYLHKVSRNLKGLKKRAEVEVFFFFFCFRDSVCPVQESKHGRERGKKLEEKKHRLLFC